MPRKRYREDDFQISEEEFEELRGSFEEYDDSARRNMIIISWVLVVAIISIFSWVLFVDTRTDEEKLQDALKSRGEIQKLLVEVSEVIRHPHVMKKELMEAVRVAVRLTTTALRVPGHVRAPYIPERGRAIMESLEGLLRLELEGYIDFSNREEKAFYDGLLKLLGRQRLEYYESGVLERVPLLRQALVEYELERERNRPGFVDERVIRDLNTLLAEVSKEESFSIVAASLVLGKWYRFYNEMENAERCFHIGRRYKDGYENGEVFYEGKKLIAISSLWDEYASCLEALTEMAFDSKRFRQARSYLIRMFSTPKSVDLVNVGRNVSEQVEMNEEEINKLNREISILKDAISSPISLPTYPSFLVTDTVVNWEGLLEDLREASTIDDHKATARFIWEQIEEGLRQKILTSTGAQWLNLDAKHELIRPLNQHVNGENLANIVHFDKKKLSERAKEYLLKSRMAPLALEERTFLNRDIIRNAFLRGIDNPFILADGTRLNNSLTDEQVLLLIDLYREEMERPGMGQRRRDLIRKKIRVIHKGKRRPTLSELNMSLNDKRAYFDQIIEENEGLYDSQRTVLNRVQQEMQEMQEQGVVDVERVFQLHTQEELARSRQHQAKIRMKQAKGEQNSVDLAIGEMNKAFKKMLVQREEDLAAAIQRQGRLRERSLTDRGPMIGKIERQMSLRQKYLQLLIGLKERGSDKELQKMEVKISQIEQQSKLLKEKMRRVSGNEREALEEFLRDLETHMHALVKEFDEIFDPLRDLSYAIAKEEEEVWKAEELLQETQAEIAEIIGTKDHPGRLQEKAARREEILLLTASSMINSNNLTEEVIQLNEEIAKDHARIQTLLQTERVALSVLETFNSLVGESEQLSLREDGLRQLQSYLEVQERIMAEYEKIWQQNEIQEDIYRQEEHIAENMLLISKVLGEMEELSEVAVNDLGRYMENILIGKQRLQRGNRELNRLFKGEFNSKRFATDREWMGREPTGYFLDNLEVYQVEHEMGVNISEYRRVFEQRKAIVLELQEALSKKDQFLRDKKIATLERDQVAVDILTPKITEIEQLIKLLGGRQAAVNTKLQLLANEYSEQRERVNRYREKAKEEAVENEKKMQELHVAMVTNDKALSSLSDQMFSTFGNFKKSLTAISVGDLKGIDHLINQQKEQLAHLKNIHQVRQLENFYKAKALWLMGKSLYEQSKLTSFDKLVASNDLPDKMVDEEIRTGQLVIEEYNPDFIYSEEMFGEEAGEADAHNANYETWVDFLEESALQIFQTELPKYVVTDADVMPIGYEGFKRQDNNVFVARSRFLSGEIFLKKALRYIRTSTAPPEENTLARRELDAGTRTFVSFTDFVNSLSTESQSSEYILTETVFGSQEFPKRERMPLRLLDEARVYLGVIATLKGNYQESIEHFRQILTDIITQLSIIDDGGSVIGQLEPLLFEEYQFDTRVHPYYASMLARNPHAHEVLYRLGKSYHLLSLEEKKRVLRGRQEGLVEPVDMMEKSEKYAASAIAYYSQLILTQAFSPYREAALLKRAQLRQVMGDYENARKDYITILGDEYEAGGSFSQEMMTSKGDLPGELDPGYAYVAFELGKLYFENKDFEAATETFRRAKMGDPENIYVLQAKVAYAQALMKMDNWLVADYFLEQLVMESEEIPEELENLYHADILVDLGYVKSKLFNFEDALLIFSEVFKKYAPVELLDRDGKLDFSNSYGLAILETDYRDSIRPIALAALHSAEVLMQQRKYTKSKEFYDKATILFKMLPWREDRILRKMQKKDFRSYRDEYVLLSKWGMIKCDVLELMFSTFANYRRQLGEFLKGELAFDSEKAIKDIDKILLQADSQKGTYEEVLQRVSSLYNIELKRLPEVLERRRIQNMREWDREIGGQAVRKYDALVRIRDTIASFKDFSPRNLMLNLIKLFTKGSLEEKFLDDFALEYAKTLDLNEEDRKDMFPFKGNLDNLVEITNSAERMKDLYPRLRKWLERYIRETGFDDLFIPVSAQSGILEEIDLYRVALMSYIDSFDRYESLKVIADKYLEEVKAYPVRIVSYETVWRIVEIAAMGASAREDWKSAEIYNSFLLQPEYASLFILEDESDLYRVKLALAQALIEVARQPAEEIAFLENEEEKMQQQKVVEEKFRRARELLSELRDLPPTDDAAVVTTRVRAKEMLNKLNAA